MSYSNDYSYCYSSGDDSFSYISDVSTSFYCPLHYPPPPPPPSTFCPIHHSYPFYFQVATPQQQQQEQMQVSIPISSSSSVFQVRPAKKESRRFTEEQIRILEEHFYKVDKYVSKVTIDDLSNRTQLKPSQIRVWFNNKRTRQHH
jgi:hypothetical protein